MKGHSVARRLTIVLVVVQFIGVVIALIAASIVYLLYVAPEGGSGESVIERMSPYIQRAADGSIVITPEGQAIARGLDDDFWFYAGDDKHSVLIGSPPPEIVPLLPNANKIVTQISGAGQAMTPAGELTLVAGNLSFSWSDIHFLVSFLSLQFGLYVLLPGIVLALVIVPRLVRRNMHPITSVADAASRMEAGKTGQRLPEGTAPIEVAPLIRAVNGALDRLDDWTTSQRRFIADAAHELRTPITVLQVRLDGLPPGKITNELKEDCARLARLANRLLQIERVRSRTTPLAQTDLSALVQRAAVQFAPRALDAGVEIAFDAASSTVMVQADADAIDDAVTNLLDNAVRHGKSPIEIAVNAGASPSVDVIDSGGGIAEDFASRMFEPFVGTPGRGGAGLGLTLVAEIMQAHNGRVFQQTLPGGKTRFRLQFPTIDPDAQA